MNTRPIWTLPIVLITLATLLPEPVSAANLRPGIDCECASVGLWRSPDIGRDLDVELGGTPSSGFSPHGLYQLTVGFDLTGKIPVQIERVSDGHTVFSLVLPASSGWGFSPDDHRFAFHFGGPGSSHAASLYNLDTDGSNEFIASTSLGSADKVHVTFSPNGRYLQYTALLGTSMVIDLIDTATGNIDHISGITLESPPAEVSIAGWGFSPDSLDSTFVYAWKHSLAAAVKVRNLATGIDVFEEVNLNLNYGPQSDTDWFFSPCGDLFAIAFENANLFRAYSTLIGLHVDDGAVFNSTDHGFFQVRAEDNLLDHLVYYSGGSQLTLPLAANTAPETCQIDSDGDGVLDPVDNCPLVHNPDQADENPANGIGDACEDDQDGDGVDDSVDNCPMVFNPDQQDSDGNGTGDACEAGDDTPPTWPAGSTLTLSNITETGLQLNWSAAEDGPYRYRLYRDGLLTDQVLAGSPRVLQVEGLEPWTFYQFRLQAEDAAGNETLDGPQAFAQTLDNQGPTWPPDAQLSVTDRTATSLTLAWSAAIDNVAVARYRLYRLEGSERHLLATLDDPNDRTHTVTCLHPNRVYSFQVEAGDAADTWSDGGPSATQATLSGPPCERILERASVSALGEQLSWTAPDDGTARGGRISADGRFIVFGADADNIRIADFAESPEIHVFDRGAGRSRPLLTLQGGTLAAHARVHQLAISADGNWVAYSSGADFLTVDDDNDLDDVFVTNRESGRTERVSVGAPGGARADPACVPPISGDGRYVVFQSLDTFGDDTDTNGTIDIYLRDRVADSTRRVSLSTNGDQAALHAVQFPDISDDSRYVVFETADTGLVSDDANICQGLGQTGQVFTFPCTDVFIRDLQTGVTERVSVDAGGNEVIGVSTSASISATGRYVAFQSSAPTLVAGDSNDAVDIFVKDTRSGSVERVSLSSAGAQANDGSFNPRISSDGRFVAFESRASNLFAGDTNGVMDVFVHDRFTGVTRLASACACGDCTDDPSLYPDVSGDGRYVSFESTATNLLVGAADSNRAVDVFLHEWSPPAGDDDPVPDAGEYGPTGADAGYDGNHDGVADARQDHVVSSFAIDGRAYVSLAAPDGMLFDRFEPIQVPASGDAPEDMAFPWGLFEFTLSGVAPQQAFSVEIYLPAGTTATRFYLYGASAGDANPHWQEFGFDGSTGAEIDGNRIVLHLINGGRGDDDLTDDNGSLRLRGGPAVPLAPEPDLFVAPGSVSFDGVALGTTAGPAILTLSNFGLSNLELSSFAISGGDALRFELRPGAGASPCGEPPLALASLQECTLGVLFAPVLAGNSQASLDIRSNDPDPAVFSVALSATTDVAPSQSIGVTPLSHDFGTLPAGNTSPPVEFTVANSGETPLEVASVTLTTQPAFELLTAATNPCGAPPFLLGAGQSCKLAATFSPTGAAQFLATLTLHSNDPDTPEFRVTLRGAGTAPLLVSAIAVVPVGHDFGAVAVDAASAPLIISLFNVGGSPAEVQALTGSALFDSQFELQTDIGITACGATPISIAGGDSCELRLAFTPTVAESMVATLTVVSGALVDGALPINLRGTGTDGVQVSALSLFPTRIDFGEVVLGQVSAPQIITLTNNGATRIENPFDIFVPPLTASGYDAFGYDFAGSHSCHRFGGGAILVLEPGASCTYGIVFRPLDLAFNQGSLRVETLDGISSNTVLLSGRAVQGGVAVAQRLSLQPESLDFGELVYAGPILQMSQPRSVILANTGGAPLQVHHIGLSDVDNFALLDLEFDCPPTPFAIAAGGHCSLPVSYTPTGTGQHNALVSIGSDDPEQGMRLVALVGRSVDAPAEASIHLSHYSYDFRHGDVNIETEPAMKQLQLLINNLGLAELTVSALTLSNEIDFGISACGQLPFGVTLVDTCIITVTFHPQSLGPVSATLTIASNDAAHPETIIHLSGIGAGDLDGLEDHVEYGPTGQDSGYDGNADGVSDSQQAHVASLPSFNASHYVTLFTSAPHLALGQIGAVANPSPGDQPASAEFPAGFFDFTVCCLDNPGEALSVTLVLPPEAAGINTYFKYGPTPVNPVPHWYEFLFDGQTGAEIDGTRILLHFVDGERGDDDLAANRQVTDIGGPGVVQDDGNDGGSCFIATAAYGSYLAPQVGLLRDFRDRYLLTHEPGRRLVALYYRVSPPIAKLVAGHESLRVATRWLLTPIVYAVTHPHYALAILSLVLALWSLRRNAARLRRLPEPDGRFELT